MHITDLASEWDTAMRTGDHQRAWAVSDAVLAKRDLATRDCPQLPYHQRWVWDGTPVDGRHVLVRCYHGLGDTLQYARFLPALAARAAQVTAEIQPELMAILAPLGTAVPFDPVLPKPRSECDVEIMELSHALRLSPRDVCPPYLPSLPLAKGEAIGLCWKTGDWDPARSLPLGLLRAALPAVPFVSLQRGTAASEAQDGFENPGDNDMDVARTARLIAGCRRIVTVDSMVAHLASALGHPTCVLLKHNADWRWEAGDQSGWYPATRLFRQQQADDWTVPLLKLAEFLKAGD